MPRVTLSDGRWLDLRPIWVSDRLAIVDLNERKITQLAAMRELGTIIEGGLTAKSWDGSLLDMPEPELLGLIKRWNDASEDHAVPPARGTSSAEQSPSGDSAEQTASRSEPPSHSSTRSDRSRSRGASPRGS